ncbi:unnamed protein product [marine sediment metagenome]|uniref:Uncharacterized protein n=1 Tax=marine sediment metagenome TaxID=412755 RepID=X0U906_9ZZZZ
MNYTKKDFKEFVRLRDKCSLAGFGNYKRNIGRLEMTEFLKKFNKKDQEDMFTKDNKKHNIKESE